MIPSPAINLRRFRPNFAEQKELLKDFLMNFQDPACQRHYIHDKKKYKIIMQQVANQSKERIVIDISDIQQYFRNDQKQGFIQSIKCNTRRYQEILSEAIDQTMPVKLLNDGFQEPIPINQGNPSVKAKKIYLRNKAARQEQQMLQQRASINLNKYKAIQAKQQEEKEKRIGMSASAESGVKQNALPPQLKRGYHLIISPGEGTKMPIIPLRQISSNYIGSLINFNAVVTRMSDVKPSAKVVTYTCQHCGSENFQVVRTRSFTPMQHCHSHWCKTNNVNGRLIPSVHESLFEGFQEIKVQEPADQVPMGSVPRHMTLIARKSNIRCCSPGDMINVSGILLPQPPEKRRVGGLRLSGEVVVQVQSVTRQKTAYQSMLVDQRMRQVFNHEASQANFFEKISQSIAPQIFGLNDEKKALMLQLMGGVDRVMADGMKIRGNLNMLLVGDPGVAKSQLLKYISHIAPRGVYTTGKGSSGAGLTAAVMRDQTTKEMALQAGALVLADTGICCIDEFDKMDESDRANIHQVMEQHTISIAKAGITTTLNARSSILAAANPKYGRFIKGQVESNINLPAALLSRFDLIFLLHDIEKGRDQDKLLAQHITDIHMPNFERRGNNDGEDDDDDQNAMGNNNRQRRGGPADLFSQEFIRGFVAHARTIDPFIPNDLINYISDKYVQMRKEAKMNEENFKRKNEFKYRNRHMPINDDMFITPRLLLSIIRCSQALARIHLRKNVEPSDINQAIRIITVAKKSMKEQKNINQSTEERRQDQISSVWQIIRNELVKSESRSLKGEQLMEILEARGVSRQKTEATLREYMMIQSLDYFEDEDIYMLC